MHNTSESMDYLLDKNVGNGSMKTYISNIYRFYRNVIFINLKQNLNHS